MHMIEVMGLRRPVLEGEWNDPLMEDCKERFARIEHEFTIQYG
jgi:hypothetical protein